MQITQASENNHLYFSNTNISIDDSNTSEEDDVNGTSGLINLGNTCYMNSIIQCLSNCDKLREFILSCDFIKEFKDDILDDNDIDFTELNEIYKDKLIFQIYRIFKAIWNSSFTEFKPVTFKKLFGEKIEIYKLQSGEQNDSQEALTCIIDTFHNEICKKVLINFKNIKEHPMSEIHEKYNQLQIGEEEKKSFEEINELQKQFDNFDETYPKEFIEYLSLNEIKQQLSNSYSKIVNIFNGFNVTTTTCPITNKNSYKFDQFFCLQVDIPYKKEESSDENSTEEKSDSKSSEDEEDEEDDGYYNIFADDNDTEEDEELPQGCAIDGNEFIDVNQLFKQPNVTPSAPPLDESISGFISSDEEENKKPDYW